MYLCKYKIEWANDYLKEQQAILAAYEGAIQLHHIGSTSVEGLYAKDCIDILGVVTELEHVKNNIVNLENLSFNYKGDYGIEGREYFSKEKRKVHFHIFQTGNINIEKHLGFVRIMKSNPSLVEKLNRLKTDLERKYPLDKELYQKEKVFFYDQIHKML
nr:GrpB family protein [Rheinheimera maricola]